MESSIARRNIFIGEGLVVLFIGSLWIPSKSAFPLWGNALGTALLTLLGAAWYVINVRYPHLVAWMQDERQVEKIIEIAVSIFTPLLLAGLDFLFWTMLQHQVAHTPLLVGMISINLGLLSWMVLCHFFPDQTEESGTLFFVACLLAVLVLAAWLAFPALIAGGCTLLALATYAAILFWHRRWHLQHSAPFDYDSSLLVEGLDAQTLAFLAALSGVTVTTSGDAAHEVILSTPDTEWNVVIEPGGRRTWLFHYTDEQLLGCDTGGGQPTRLWIATPEMWFAQTCFGFAMARFAHERELGLLAPDAQAPNPEEYPD